MIFVQLPLLLSLFTHVDELATAAVVKSWCQRRRAATAPTMLLFLLLHVRKKSAGPIILASEVRRVSPAERQGFMKTGG